MAHVAFIATLQSIPIDFFTQPKGVFRSRAIGRPKDGSDDRTREIAPGPISLFRLLRRSLSGMTQSVLALPQIVLDIGKLYEVAIVVKVLA